eukprot:12880907-Prorocentrum_lima.AAC.1
MLQSRTVRATVSQRKGEGEAPVAAQRVALEDEDVEQIFADVANKQQELVVIASAPPQDFRCS